MRRWPFVFALAALVGRPFVAAGEAQEAPVSELRILHLTDSHISLSSDLPPYSNRMTNAFAHTTRYTDGAATTALNEFELAMQRIKKEKPDVVAIGGDMVNYPDTKTLNWALEKLLDTGVPFLFMNGNHDWHLERVFSNETRYDSQLQSHMWQQMFQPLYDASGKNVPERSFSDPRFGFAIVKGVAVVMMDNSNYQIDEDQLAFFTRMVDSNRPIVLVVHIPLCFPGLEWMSPKLVMGHPKWSSATDDNARVENRLPWPSTGNLASTVAFIREVERAAVRGSLLKVLSGHTHEYAVNEVPENPRRLGEAHEYLSWTNVPIVPRDLRQSVEVLSEHTDTEKLHLGHTVMQVTSGPGFAGYSPTFAFSVSSTDQENDIHV